MHSVSAPPAADSGAALPPRRRSPRAVAATVAAFLVAALVGGGAGAYLALHRPVNLANLMALSPLPVHPAPGFTLVDQSGQRVSLASLRGRVVVVNFFDDRCTDLCPIISQEMIDASHDLGAKADRVAFVAVNVNAAHEGTRWVRDFTHQHGLTALPHWYFLTGTTPALKAVWRRYQVDVQVDRQGNVYHSSPMYFIDAAGRERAVAGPHDITRPDGTGYLPPGQLRDWGRGIAKEVRALL